MTRLRRTLLSAGLVCLASVPLAHAQDGHGMNHGAAGHGMSAGASPKPRAATDLPEACQGASTSAGGAQGGMGSMGDMMTPAEPESEAGRAYVDAMGGTHEAMMQGLRVDDPDVAFVCGMIPHHRSAVAMAEVVLEYGKDPFARRLAQDVIASQGVEIEQMLEWLAKREN
ncbi:DUF305 domain-containing protein [Fulvimarina sp. 2208YS6-2-32]|uniref:DUF305 domain-containing protein n=1 Tax=Fulvimarina uroteuthidis TaxID=3098149 RepID=A0ABU5I3K1_9HYPH|nr:DUF305 domain-containing protein [Fulvimarina sp. 2208YS6-2-32]MDY8109933.1 DUF305 domain-containing protein [Fulvimarina sp. 2208YS6-2-32]